MNFRALCALVLAATVAIALPACSGVADPSKNKTDDITDTLAPFLDQIYSFTASKNGEYSVTITALSNPNVVLGVGVGLLNSFGTCSTVIGSTDLAVLNRTALTGSLNKGNYCLSVYDNLGGTLTDTVTFTVRLSHP
jgi:hypothetical protein